MSDVYSEHIGSITLQATLRVPISVERVVRPLDYINPMHSLKRSEVWYGKHISQEI
jgi:hypothetical protein